MMLATGQKATFAGSLVQSIGDMGRAPAQA